MDDEVLLRRYLTGELAQDEAEALERRLLAEDGLFEACEALDDELVMDCVRGELPAAQRDHVLGRLSVSPAGRSRLDFARALAEVAGAQAAPPRPVHAPSVLRWVLLAAAALAVLVAALWLLVGRSELEQPTRRVESPAPPPHPLSPSPIVPPPPGEGGRGSDVVPREPERIAQQPRALEQPLPAILQLSLVVRRSGTEIPHLELGADARRVEIQIDLDAGERFTSFWGLLRDAASGELRREGPLAVRPTDWGFMLVLDLPVEELPAGSYELEVLGVVRGDGNRGESQRESLGRLPFEVVAPAAPA
jgi:hypothetical protein